MTKREVVAAALQGSGLSSGVAAAWLVQPALGLLTLGASLVVAGLAVERRR